MGEGRILGKASVAFTAEEDAIILECVPKHRPLSAHVRTGRSVDAIMRRYADLIKGKAKTTDARIERKPRTENQKERIRAGLAESRQRRGSRV